jgi:23S rRNA pseudouridine1911/1915/1917 synthase
MTTLATIADDRAGRRAAVPASAAGSRLDAFIAEAMPELSRTRAKALILAGAVAVGGVPVTEPRRSLNPGDEVTVTVPPPQPATPQPEAIALDIVYEDAELIVIDKPAGLVVHPAAGNQTGTLVNALIAHCGASLSGIGGVMRPGIVHRLDKDTSGLLVVAKTDRAHQSLSAQFADHGRSGPLERGYLALVWGAPERREGTVAAPLARSPRNREKIAVVATGGREAITHYRLVEAYGTGVVRGSPLGGRAPRIKPGAGSHHEAPAVAALLDCRLETGRTHQIRVHMAAIGHPLIGDRTYGAGFATKAALLPEPARGLAEAFPRQALHAWLLGFEHPATGAEMRFERPPPADMGRLREALGPLKLL